MIVDCETSTPVDPAKAAASKLPGAPDPLNTKVSFAGSKPVIIESLSRETTLEPSKLTSTINVSAAEVAAYEPPSRLIPDESELESEPEEPELEPESGVGLTAPPPPSPPQAARIKGKLIAVNKLSSLLYVLNGDKVNS